MSNRSTPNAIHRVAPETWRRYLHAVPWHERRIAQRKTKRRDRDAFLACRGLLRLLLARRLKRAPGAITLRIDARGRPAVVRGPVAFSISHGTRFSLVAIAEGRRLGIDIAFLDRRRDAEAMAEGYFTTAERAAILQSPPATRQRVMLRAWTRHEALGKATGRGLVIPARAVSHALRVHNIESRDGTWVATVAVGGRGRLTTSPDRGLRARR